MKTLLRCTALLLALLLLCPALLACAKDKPSVNAEQVVGTADGVKIRYDELYFLIKTYEETLRAKYEGDAEGFAEALDELAREELLANAAILRLCEKHGLSYKESALSDDVDTRLESILYTDFGGDEDAYHASLEENGLTERYLRYTLGLDILYGELTSIYPSEGLVVTDTPQLLTYIKNHFICVYHVARFNEAPEEDYANRQVMTKARRDLITGQKTMYELIGSTVNEDFSDVSGKGHYLTRGTWDETYEDAAFALSVGEVSEVVLATGVSPKTGATVPTYYVIQRAELDEDYIEKNLSDFQDEYYASVIYSDLTELRESMSFEPNSFYDSLDLTNLLPPEENNNTLVIVLCTVGGVLLIGGGITAILLIRRKKKKNSF